MGTTNILDLNNRVSDLKKATMENAEDMHDSEKDIYAVMGQMGAKNLNSYPYVHTTRTTNGITFTDNGDGTITANGTATGDAYFSCHTRFLTDNNGLIIPNGSYVLNGCPAGGSTSKYMIQAGITRNDAAYSLARETGNGATVEINGDDYFSDKVILQLQCIVKSGITVDNIVFKPMLRLASITDDTYQPYAKTNKQLTDEVLTKIPDAPTTDGTYNLSVTVVNGTPTYSWVSTS